MTKKLDSGVARLLEAVCPKDGTPLDKQGCCRICGRNIARLRAEAARPPADSLTDEQVKNADQAEKQAAFWERYRQHMLDKDAASAPKSPTAPAATSHVDRFRSDPRRYLRF